jgi:hypothetical protein
MAYDSATAVQQASDAYKRALAVAQQRRTALNTGYGLRGDAGHEGEIDNSPAGILGSIYQTGLTGERGYESAARSDRSRGFGGTGGLAGRNRSRAREDAVQNQAVAFRDAATSLGGVTEEEQRATQDYRDQVGADGTGGIIGRNAAWDLAQTLAANPVFAPAPAPASPLGVATAPATAFTPAALKKNPRAAQTARNRF